MEGRARERWRRQEEGRIPVPRAPQKSRHSQGSPPVFINWRGRGPGGRPLAGRTVRGKRAYARERAPRGAARLPRLAQRAPVRQRPLAPAFAPTALPSSPLSKQLTLLPVKGRQSQDAGTDVEGAAGRGRCGGWRRTAAVPGRRPVAPARPGPARGPGGGDHPEGGGSPGRGGQGGWRRTRERERCVRALPPQRENQQCGGAPQPFPFLRPAAPYTQPAHPFLSTFHSRKVYAALSVT